MGTYYTSQWVYIDFSFDSNVVELELTADDLITIEDQIMDAIDDCNKNIDVDITGMSVIEGLDWNRDLNEGWLNTEDGFHMIVECDIEIDGSDGDISGIHIKLADLVQRIAELYIIGEYVDTSTLDISVSSIDEYDLEYESDEPDWDSMPGGPDYYND